MKMRQLLWPPLIKNSKFLLKRVYKKGVLLVLPFLFYSRF
jgi:hypothetical protein